MKRLLSLTAALVFCLYSEAQVSNTDILTDLESTQQSENESIYATVNSATRLFRDKDDLTSVLMIIPRGSVANVLDTVDTYLQISFEGNKGYIDIRHAVAEDRPPADKASDSFQKPSRQEPASRQVHQESRLSILERKYGSDMASQICSGKIWKGMSAEMVNDSWGTPLKINRVISGSNIKEEWIYKSTWLYFQNRILVEWGPAKK